MIMYICPLFDNKFDGSHLLDGNPAVYLIPGLSREPVAPSWQPAS